MNSATLSLRTLHHLSTDLDEDFKQQLEAAIRDCVQRPSLAKKREVNLRLEIIPHPSDPEDVLIQPITTRKTPCRTIDPIRGRIGRNSQLQFDFDGETDGASAA